MLDALSGLAVDDPASSLADPERRFSPQVHDNKWATISKELQARMTLD